MTERDYTIYRTATGAYVKSLTMPDLLSLSLNHDADYETAIEGSYPPASYLKGGVVKIKPERPGPWAKFDFDSEQWFDPRTDSDLTAELAAAREATHLSRIEFCDRAMAMGIFTPDDAKQASRGIVPEHYRALLGDLSAYDMDMIEIRWAGASVISRMDPFILMVAERLHFSEELVDDLFGVHT